MLFMGLIDASSQGRIETLSGLGVNALFANLGLFYLHKNFLRRNTN